MSDPRIRLVARGALLAAALAACRPPPEAPPLPLPTPPSTYELLAARCDRGDGPACVEVAVQHRELGDLVGANLYAHRGCDLASSHGCAALARAWERGEGLDRDPEAATSLYVTACLGGHAPSCIAAADGLRGPEADALRRKGCAAAPLLCRRPAAAPAGVDPLDQANVVAGMSARREDLRDCYVRTLERRPPPRGRVWLEIALAGDGHVLAVAIRENVAGAPELGACLADVAAAAAFAPTAAGALAVVPWRVQFDRAP